MTSLMPMKGMEIMACFGVCFISGFQGYTNNTHLTFTCTGLQLLKAQRRCYPNKVLQVDKDLVQRSNVEGGELKRTM